jgi:IS1 transposase.
MKVKGRVVDVSTEVVFGKMSEVMQAIKKSPVSKHINTSFVERNNLTMRERNRRLTRKTTGFSKRKRFLVASLNIFLAIYHFVKPHKGLRIRVDQEDRKWIQRTPMMAANITDHIWTVKELVIYRVN